MEEDNSGVRNAYDKNICHDLPFTISATVKLPMF